MSASPAETNAARWAQSRTFHHSLYPAERVAAERGKSVSVCVPARECAGTIEEIVRALVSLREVGAIDEIVVVDAASADGTALVAQRAGATVHQEAELLPDYGPVLGKGDAMWRALSVLEGELVCFVDADTEGFSTHFVTGLLGPLVCGPEASEVSFVKAFYRRPLGDDDDGGGRVNRLTARPALALLYPELSEVRQPLAGEVAARRELLDELRFETGYGVEMGMLIDAWSDVGLQGLAQVDLGEHRHEHKPLSELAPMARTVLMAILARLETDDHLGPWYDRLGLTGEAEWEVLEDLDPTPAKRPSLAAIGMARSAR